MRQKEIVIGQHGVYHLLLAKKREIEAIYCTAEGKKNFQKKFPQMDLKSFQVLDPHSFQQRAKQYYQEQNFEFTRIVSQLFAVANPIDQGTVEDVYQACADHSGRVRIICLDQVTDVNNAAAILRTAAFFQVDFLVTARRGGFGISPPFTRIASGALEYVQIIRCDNLARFLTRLQDRGMEVVGLSEQAQPWNPAETPLIGHYPCLVLGAEDLGISHAVTRILNYHFSLTPLGAIHSLNVSVAAALAMEQFFRGR